MKFTDTHEWVRLEGDVATVGITAYAQKELGDVVYVELPREGKELSSGEEVVILESTKAAVDLYTPLSGKIVEANVALREKPETINNDPLEEGWLFKIQINTPSEYEGLLDEAAYQKLTGSARR